MGDLMAFSQSSLLLLPQSRLCTSRRGHFVSRSQASLAVIPPMCFLSVKNPAYAARKQKSFKTITGVVSDSKVPTTFTVDSAGGGIDILPDSGGSDDNFGGDDESEGHEKKAGMSMSQKLTLGYAALVGIGGLMGFLKGGSKKSLIAGGLSASLLLYVYTALPSNPVLASSVGLVLSASLLGVMGSRFKNSGKIFPAGVVSIVSLVMSGGYLHGIMRSLH
ncbi:hypothetical protein MIMGU_mgv1a027152mg [Erythranthe guttata]|uniref:Uncharacterized protein n=1 Tax=Erythranthe guttata TaxID=4155 RepID=A0A022Q409_ERYGU|nr:hypothetical protein MIMGU_mgv1a027152mg [Erythranthe guttata]